MKTVTAKVTVIGDLTFDIPDGVEVDLKQLQEYLPSALRLEHAPLDLCIEINEDTCCGIDLKNHTHGDIALADVHEITAELEAHE